MLLELSGLSAHFGKKQVLHQMSLSVGEGEVVALIGPNAAGKSTTMRCVLGLKATSAGSIVFHGRCVDALGTSKRVRELPSGSNSPAKASGAGSKANAP